MLKKFLKDESGQVLVLTLVSATLLMAFMALAIDVGILFRARRNMQIAADAAAVAGAMQVFYGPAARVTNAAYAAAAANGVDHTVTGNTVQIGFPPADGPNQSCMTCVEVQVAAPNKTFFMSMFLPGMQLVSARAVAGSPSLSNACVWLMDPTMDNALDLTGGGTISASNCGIYINSNSSNAVSTSGSGINATGISIVGNDSGAMSLDPGKVQTRVVPESPDIPLNLGSVPSSSCTSTVSAAAITTAMAATVSGSAANNVVCFTANNVEIDAGVNLAGAPGNGVLYVFQNGVKLDGSNQFGSYSGPLPGNGGTFNASQTNGATVDIAAGALTQATGALSIYAPTSGAYNAIALMQPASNTTGTPCPGSPVSPCLLIQRGTSGSVFDGIVYAPGMYVELQDHAGSVYATGLIADGLFVTASDLILNGYSQANPTTSPFRTVTLLE